MVALGRGSLLGVLFAQQVACGWFEDATAFTVCSPPQAIALDTAELVPIGETADLRLPRVPCEAAAECGRAFVTCSTPSDPATSFSCEASCTSGVAQAGGSDGPDAARAREGDLCAASVDIGFEQHTDLDLREQIDSQSKANLAGEARLTRLELTVADNTLSFAIPPLDILVGPSGAEDTADARVQLLARIDGVPAGPSPMREIPSEESGREQLARLVRDFERPVRLFVRTRLRFESGDPLPKGRLDASIKACFRAELL